MSEEPQQVASEAEAPALPSFPKRVWMAFLEPGRLTEALAANPAWALALGVGALLVIGQTLLIPAEIWDTVFREAMMERAQELPEGFEFGGTVQRVSAVVGGTIAYVVMTLLFAGIVTLVFAFFMGDEGRYKQYLALLAHAFLIPAILGFALVPLRISQENPQLTLNLGSFLFFLPEGYLTRFATLLDLTQIWAWLVVAQGAHAIDARRSFGSAAAVVMALFVVVALLFAFLPWMG